MEAVKVLNSLQPSPEALRKKLNDPTRDLYEPLKHINEYMLRTDINHDDLNKLGVIHITGTKGKGSTSAYCESILRHQGYKTGFFSSPHLMEVRERFRINGKPMSKEKFCQIFWVIYNQLVATKAQYEYRMPRFFCFCTLLACHLFKQENVDVFIMEVGIGGEYDETNLVPKPYICAVTSLDIDHVDVLGNTIESITWHKSGIFKKGSRGVTSEQPEKAMEVMLSRSKDRQCPVYVALPLAEEYGNILSIRGEKQRLNAGLAVEICRLWNIRHKTGQSCSSEDITLTNESLHGVPILQSAPLSQEEKKGLSECKWYGRNQIVHKPGITYYLDGAHTKDSMRQCATWFKSVSKSEESNIEGKVVRILILNVTGDRDVASLVSFLKPCEFDAAAFTPNRKYKDISKNRADEFELSNNDEMKQIQSRRCKQIWDNTENDTMINNTENDVMVGNTKISHYFPCITDTLVWVTQGRDANISNITEETLPDVPPSLKDANHLQVLVTGSLHLVGGVLLQISPGLND